MSELIDDHIEDNLLEDYMNGKKKTFYLQDNIGKVKYTVNFYDGIQKHDDGSPFFRLRTFTNKRKRNSFLNELKKEGYTEQ